MAILATLIGCQGIDEFKAKQKNSEITEDDLRTAEDKIQKMTDKKIEEIDQLLEAKEKERTGIKGKWLRVGYNRVFGYFI